MGKASKAPWGGSSTLFMLVSVAAFVWGLERWRKDAARKAGTSASARLTALSRCVLGPDGPALMRTPSAARLRLRAIAMGTSTRADVTWLDRCVPLANSLARHGVEVDNTKSVTAAQTRFERTSLTLAQAVGRVGLAWAIRAGDTDMDMDQISERMLDAATELDLAGAPSVAPNALDGPVAPAPPALAEGARIETVGLEPMPYGSPWRFFVGAPMPVLGELFRDESGWHRRPVAGEASVLFRTGAGGVTRADAFADPLTEGLARVRWLRPGADPYVAHVTLIDNPEDARHVSMDAAPAGAALWFAEWSPWRGGVLAPFVGEMARTSVALPMPSTPGGMPSAAGAPGAPGAAGAGSIAQALGGPVAAATVRGAASPAPPPVDEHVALAAVAGGVVVAYTARGRDDDARVMLASARWERGRVAITALGDVTAHGRAPGLEFCKLEPDAAALFVAGARGWEVLRVSAAGALSRIGGADRAEGEAWFDERAVVRCDRDGAVAYGRERTRESPVLLCRSGEPGRAECESLHAPQVPAPATIPAYATRGPSGRPMAHVEWPLSFARAGDTLLAASAVGPVVSVLRREPGGAWDDGAVVFDAAAPAHGMSVAGMELFAEGGHAVLAVGVQDGLHVFESDDGGRTWR